MIARTIFSEEHEIFCSAARRFVETEMVPHHRAWERAGVVPRELWRKAGEQGLLCPNVEEAYGGNGGDWLYNVVVVEELARAGVSGPGSGFMVHSEMVASYLVSFASEQTKQRYLPRRSCSFRTFARRSKTGSARKARGSASCWASLRRSGSFRQSAASVP
jgi:alkylation response protein AidB-like acyl-CoA dehydrogenase